MEDKINSESRWDYEKWLEKNYSPSTTAGWKIPTPLRSYDIRSPGYLQTLKRLELHCWGKAAPFALLLWPHQFADNQRTGEWYLKRNNYPHVAVELILEGEVLCEIEGETHHLSPGDILLTQPGDSLVLRSSKRKSRELQILISGNILNTFLIHSGLSMQRIFHQDDPETAETMMRKIGDLIAKRSEARKLFVNACDFLMYLAEQRMKGNESKESPLLLSFAIQAMNTCSGVRMSISELSAELGVCPTTLTRLFRRHLNISPRRYYELFKLEKAKDLLQTRKNMPIKEIALSLGFANQYYFSTVFRKLTGKSPMEFRKSSIGEPKHRKT